MKKRIFIISAFALITLGLSGQTMKQYVKSANESFNKKDYYSALYFLSLIQEIDSTRIDLQFKQAEAARHFNAYQLAEKRYQQVLESEETEQFPMAIFWKATVQKMQGKYDEAIAGFEQYLKDNPDDTLQYFKEATDQIEACGWAKELIKYTDNDLKILQLGEEVNSNYSEFGAVDYQGQLLFSSLKFELEKDKSDPPKKFSKVLTLKEGEYHTTPFDLGVTGKDVHTAHTAFNQAEDRLFYNLCHYVDGNIIRCKLYYKDKVSDTLWSEPIKLPESINAVGTTTTHPNVGYNEKLGKEVLYFISDRTGGKGGMDIWYSALDENGLPEFPQNLASVNTTKDEYSPFFHTYSQTLYFSSDGRKSLGGFDIYKSEYKEGKWQAIDHTGYPLNTSYNDIYFYLNQIGSEGYISSNREGSAFLEKELTACCNDIFKTQFNSYPLDLEILTYLKSKGIDTELADVTITLYEVYDDEETEKEILYRIKPNGHQHFYKIKSNKKYKIVAEKPDYQPVIIEFNTDNPIPGEKIIKRIFIEPLNLNVLTFESGTPNIELLGANVTLYEISENGDRIKIELERDPEENSYLFPLKFKKKYLLIVDKEGYDTKEVQFNTMTWTSTERTLKKEVVLDIPVADITLIEFKPFPLYFDNDFPNPRSRDTLTEMTFPMTLKEYKSRKQDFKAGYSKGLKGEKKIMAEYEIEQFFEIEMDDSYQQFIDFTNNVYKRLKLKRSVTIKVKAYTSPLASSDYNLNLSKRRINSMLNFYRTYDNGGMAQYIDDGSLNIVLEPYGEQFAPKNISDNPNDRRNSVYGLEASKQRKVEIIQVEAKKSTPNISVNE